MIRVRPKHVYRSEFATTTPTSSTSLLLVTYVLPILVVALYSPVVRQVAAFVQPTSPIIRRGNGSGNGQQSYIPCDSSTTTTLYGIKGFRGWFERTFPTAVVPIPRAKGKSAKGGKSRKSADSNDDGQHSDHFDHVLVDVNQLLHVAMRRSNSPNHALVLMIKELDKLIALAKPTRSIVLALDGPPSAAKLATQRGRRYGILQRGALHKRTLDFLVKRGVIGPDHPELSGLSAEEFSALGIEISGPDGWASIASTQGDGAAATNSRPAMAGSVLERPKLSAMPRRRPLWQ